MIFVLTMIVCIGSYPDAKCSASRPMEFASMDQCGGQMIHEFELWVSLGYRVVRARCYNPQ